MNNYLEAVGLEKSYHNKKVVDDVSIRVKKGEIVGLLGPNGAGKTTSFSLILGLVPHDAGKVTLDGEDITDLPMYVRARMGIGYLSQEPSIFRHLSVEDNLAAILEMLPFSPEERRNRLNHFLQELGLADLRRQRADTLSGGEKRRLEIARAMIMKPKFIFLDEPFTGIDPITVIEIQKIILKLRERNIGVIITDHNVKDTFDITDRVYVIHKGEILSSGNPHEIVREERTRELFLGYDFEWSR